jgi:hypothetical protein
MMYLYFEDAVSADGILQVSIFITLLYDITVWVVTGVSKEFTSTLAGGK